MSGGFRPADGLDQTRLPRKVSASAAYPIRDALHCVASCAGPATGSWFASTLPQPGCSTRPKPSTPGGPRSMTSPGPAATSRRNRRTDGSRNRLRSMTDGPAPPGGRLDPGRTGRDCSPLVPRNASIPTIFSLVASDRSRESPGARTQYVHFSAMTSPASVGSSWSVPFHDSNTRSRRVVAR